MRSLANLQLAWFLLCIPTPRFLWSAAWSEYSDKPQHTKKPMTTQYTSGPWNHKEQWGYYKIHSEDEGVSVVHGIDPKAEANARLISTAPELLQIAKDYVLLCQLHDWEGAVLDSALAAIAKAEGK
jgi:hypothetical protein